jgi:hypothetical protein
LLQTITEGASPRHIESALSTVATGATAKRDEARSRSVIVRRALSASTTITNGENPFISVGRLPPRQ